MVDPILKGALSFRDAICKSQKLSPFLKCWEKKHNKQGVTNVVWACKDGGKYGGCTYTL